VVPAIARALGLPERGGRVPVEGLAAALAGRELLFVLDNCEHVLSAGPAVAALVAAGPTLRVLATSRELLRVAGEHDFPVSPLALPNGRSAPIDPRERGRRAVRPASQGRARVVRGERSG